MPPSGSGRRGPLPEAQGARGAGAPLRRRIGDYIRITIGTRAQMDALLERLEGLL
ncbi:MAG: hypothetical protein ACLUES_04925 [Flavonifractor plautii]